MDEARPSERYSDCKRGGPDAAGATRKMRSPGGPDAAGANRKQRPPTSRPPPSIASSRAEPGGGSARGPSSDRIPYAFGRLENEYALTPFRASGLARVRHQADLRSVSTGRLPGSAGGGPLVLVEDAALHP